MLYQGASHQVIDNGEVKIYQSENDFTVYHLNEESANTYIPEYLSFEILNDHTIYISCDNLISVFDLVEQSIIHQVQFHSRIQSLEIINHDLTILDEYSEYSRIPLSNQIQDNASSMFKILDISQTGI